MGSISEGICVFVYFYVMNATPKRPSSGGITISVICQHDMSFYWLFVNCVMVAYFNG
jgi:hypothetical protein